MPEEVNRILTDRLSCWLFTPSADADANLRAEGIPAESIHRVGNVMIDTLFDLLPVARDRADEVARRIGLTTKRYAVLTLHRPATVDHPTVLRHALEGIGEVGAEIPVLFPVHPRTLKLIADAGLRLPDGVVPLDPLGYLDFLAVMDGSALVLTDSGGMQEETSVLGIPCITLRPTTERPITVELGTNRVVGTDPEAIAVAARESLARERAPSEIPLWDGHAADRIAFVMASWFDEARSGEPGLCRPLRS